MSKTDKTVPWRVVHARGECPGHGYPCRCLSISKTLQAYRRKHQRHERTQVRVSLAKGCEPEPQQHRHRAIWEAV